MEFSHFDPIQLAIQSNESSYAVERGRSAKRLRWDRPLLFVGDEIQWLKCGKIISVGKIVSH